MGNCRVFDLYLDQHQGPEAKISSHVTNICIARKLQPIKNTLHLVTLIYEHSISLFNIKDLVQIKFSCFRLRLREFLYVKMLFICLDYCSLFVLIINTQILNLSKIFQVRTLILRETHPTMLRVENSKELQNYGLKYDKATFSVSLSCAQISLKTRRFTIFHVPTI